MPSSYTSSLRLTLPVTGELTGAWGDTINDGITALVDSSIAGTANVSHDDSANYVLTFASGSADQARQMVLNVTGTLTEARNVVCPSLSKLYLFKNATTGGFPAVLKTSGGTGIAVPAGAIAFLYCDGTNVVDANTYISTLGVSTLAVADLSAAIASLGAAGANSLTLTDDLAVAHGGTGASDAATARTNLGVQAFAAGLTDIAGLAVTDGNVIVGDGTNWVAESGATARTSLGLAIGVDVQAYDADTAKTDVAQTFTVAQRGAISTLTDGATITPDFATSNNFEVFLEGNRTMANPTNLTAGQSGSIFITQDGAGSRTLSWGSYWEFVDGIAPTLSTTALASDRIDYIVRSSSSIHAVFSGNYV